MAISASTAGELARIWRQLAERDYAITSDRALGLPAATRQHICRTYFTEKVLEGDNPAVHQDRDRARDVIRYRWRNDGLRLREHDVVTIHNRSGYLGDRTPTRTWLLDDPVMTGWLEAALSLVPPHLRHEDGTFGVNFMRTRTRVVSGPHQDDEEYVLVYVADKVGTGAESTLQSVAEHNRIVLRHTLRPGELLIFRDAAFLHNASPLISSTTGNARRDALVCTVNYPDTYDLTTH